MTELAVIAVLALPLLTAGAVVIAPARRLDLLNTIASIITGGAAVALGIVALTHADAPLHGRWYVLDAAAGVYLLLVAVIGLLSALASPGYLVSAIGGFFGDGPPGRPYYAAFQVFWAALLAIPLIDNLAVAWIVIEATTAASALLVASSGRSRALEAGWKYLVLTTLGLTVALLGIVVLYATLPGGNDASLGTVDWSNIHDRAASIDPAAGLLALVFILAGLATKIGWAPVHNWLPDAHSEAPPPISALLSAALLPTVMLVAWRTQVALEPTVRGTGTALFLAFGLISLFVAVPFLWSRLPLKRLLAYSSLEHMGILALGIGFATPLATAGVIIHLGGHALAKALGFYAAIPLLRQDPDLSTDPPISLNSSSPTGARAIALSLATLSGLPPLPLFFSEALILLGGIAAGEIVVVALAAGALALGFLGLAHAMIESVAGDAPNQVRTRLRADRRLTALTLGVATGLVALSACVFALPDSDIVAQFMRGVT